MKVSTREKRIIAIGAVVVVAVLIYYALASLLPNRDSLSKTVELKKKMLLRHRDTLSREETYKARLEQYTIHFEQVMTRLLPGDNPNVAGAELQKVLKDFADRSGVEISSMYVSPEKNVQERITRVSVRIETSCTLDQLVQFLAAIENYEKFLTLDEFMITSFQIQKKYQIRPSLTVSGYINLSENKAGEKR